MPWAQVFVDIAKGDYYNWRYFDIIRAQNDILYAHKIRYWGGWDEIQGEMNNVLLNSATQPDFKTEFRNLLTNKMNIAKQNEKVIYNNINKKGNTKTKYSDYEVLWNNKTELIKFWTTTWLNGLNSANDTINLDSQTCFSLFLLSQELYDELKSSVAELFSRTKATGQAQADNLTSDAAINQLLNDVKGIFSSSTNKVISQALYDIIQNAAKKELANIKNQKATLATTFSANLREQIRKQLALEGKEKFELQNANNEYYLRVYTNQYQGSKNKIYANMRGYKLVNNQSILNSILKSFRYVLGNLKEGLKSKNGIKELKLRGLGTVAIDEKFIDNCYAELGEKCRTEADQSIRKTIKKLVGDDVASLKPANSNAFVSGFLGELGTAYPLKNYDTTRLTGSLYEQIRGETFGASVNDLTLAINGTKMGINVKHYMKASSDKSIKIYNSSEGLSTTSKYMNKYFTNEEIQLITYITANADFLLSKNDISLATLENKIREISLREIGTFLRVYTQEGENTVDNYFFQLQNLMYPTSYIYECALNSINTLIEQQNSNGLFTISLSNTQSATKYNLIKDAFNDWDRDFYKIEPLQSKSEDAKATIKNNGFTVNLVNLNLKL